MCSRVRCRECGKSTWAGCGAHIEQALRGVPAEERCKCREQARSGASSQAAPKSWWDLLGR